MRNRRFPPRDFRPLAQHATTNLRRARDSGRCAITRIRAGHRDERFMLGSARRSVVVTRHTMQLLFFALRFTVGQPSKSRWLGLGSRADFDSRVARAGPGQRRLPVDPGQRRGDRDSIRVTFRNLGKLPIRRIEFSCVLAGGRAHPASSADCREDNAMFFWRRPTR